MKSNKKTRKKSSKIGYLIKEGFTSIFNHGFMSFATITIIIACLVIMGTFSLLALNIDAMIDELEADNQIIAYVEESLTEDEARALGPAVSMAENVNHIEFVTREEAMEQFSSQYEDQSLFEDVGAEVFRDRFVVYLDDISMMSQTQEALYEIPGIAKVNAHLDVAEGFITVRNVTSAICLVLIVVLVIVSVFIMANTIKLATVSRRDEIAIMRMVGASDVFIRFPFIVEGSLLGLFGGFLAYLIQWGLYDVLTTRIMTGIVGTLMTFLPFAQFSILMLCTCLGVGLIVGVFGSSIAIRNYLKV